MSGGRLFIPFHTFSYLFIPFHTFSYLVGPRRFLQDFGRSRKGRVEIEEGWAGNSAQKQRANNIYALQRVGNHVFFFFAEAL